MEMGDGDECGVLAGNDDVLASKRSWTGIELIRSSYLEAGV